LGQVKKNRRNLTLGKTGGTKLKKKKTASPEIDLQSPPGGSKPGGRERNYGEPRGGQTELRREKVSRAIMKGDGQQNTCSALYSGGVTPMSVRGKKKEGTKLKKGGKELKP